LSLHHRSVRRPAQGLVLFSGQA